MIVHCTALHCTLLGRQSAAKKDAGLAGCRDVHVRYADVG